MTGDSGTQKSHTNHPKLYWCPRCGERSEPLFSTSGDGRAMFTMECPNHGEIEVTYNEA